MVRRTDCFLEPVLKWLAPSQRAFSVPQVCRPGLGRMSLLIA